MIPRNPKLTAEKKNGAVLELLHKEDTATKILYRGRMIRLRISRQANTDVSVEHRSRFRFRAPRDADDTAIRVMDLRHVWGSCGRGGILHLNWKLIFAPKAMLEYAVVYELAHLRHRDHAAAFWRTVGEMIDDYARRREWLASKEDFLTDRDIRTQKQSEAQWLNSQS